MIGIIIAMQEELAPYIENNQYEKKEILGKTFYLLKISNKDCVIVHSGIGKVNASFAATMLIREFNPEFIISTGISGGLGVSHILDLVASTSCVQYDVDTTALGDELGFVSTVNKKYFDADNNLQSKFKQIKDIKLGVFACGDKFVSNKQESTFIQKTFNAIACDMESGAIAQIAYIAKTPYIAIRCISDGADDDASISFEQMKIIASQKLHNAITTVL